MTEHATDVAAGAAETKPVSGSPVRLVVRIILFAILAYLLCALPYDFLIARKGEDQAWNTLQELLENNNTRKGRPDTTIEKVQERLQRKPTSTSTTDHGETLEVYSWTGGLPWKKYTIYVTYYESKDGIMLANAYRNESPDQVAADVPQVKKETSPPTNPLSPGGTPGAGAAGGLPPAGGLGSPPGIGPGARPGAGGPEFPGGQPGGVQRPTTRPEAEEPAKEPSKEDGKKTDTEGPEKNSDAGEPKKRDTDDSAKPADKAAD